MVTPYFISNFSREIIKATENDANIVTQQLATFIDNQVIARKFDEGFPGHQLSQRTIKRKKSTKVGIETGALRRAATLFTNWSLFHHRAGMVYRAAVKKKYGLTWYAHMVRTRIGGELDFLGLSKEDLTNVENKIQALYRAKNYKGSGKVRINLL